MTLNELIKELSRPFPLHHHRYRVFATSKNGAWVAFYVDLRRMEERLQEVLGTPYSLTVEPISGHDGYNVKVSLRISLDDALPALVIEEFGYATSDTNEGLKAAATDGMRRVLSHLGIGRYLYYLPRIFITGEKLPNGTYQFDEDPLKVLDKVLSEPQNEEVLFFGNKGRRNSEDKGRRSNQNTKRWAEYLGVDEDEIVPEFKSAFNVSRSSDKQVSAFMSLVSPDDMPDMENADTVIKQMLDEKLGKR